MKRSLSLAVLVLLAGCASPDQFHQPYTWAPNDVNDANLRIMVANPDDLSHGVDSPGSLSAESSPAIRRLLEGRRTPLPATDASAIGTQGQQQQQTPPPAAQQ